MKLVTRRFSLADGKCQNGFKPWYTCIWVVRITHCPIPPSIHLSSHLFCTLMVSQGTAGGCTHRAKAGNKPRTGWQSITGHTPFSLKLTVSVSSQAKNSRFWALGGNRRACRKHTHTHTQGRPLVWPGLKPRTYLLLFFLSTFSEAHPLYVSENWWLIKHED